jgi:hypothetical protein
LDTSPGLAAGGQAPKFSPNALLKWLKLPRGCSAGIFLPDFSIVGGAASMVDAIKADFMAPICRHYFIAIINCYGVPVGDGPVPGVEPGLFTNRVGERLTVRVEENSKTTFITRKRFLSVWVSRGIFEM